MAHIRQKFKGQSSAPECEYGQCSCPFCGYSGYSASVDLERGYSSASATTLTCSVVMISTLGGANKSRSEDACGLYSRNRAQRLIKTQSERGRSGGLLSGSWNSLLWPSSIIPVAWSPTQPVIYQTALRSANRAPHHAKASV